MILFFIKGGKILQDFHAFLATRPRHSAGQLNGGTQKGPERLR